MLKQARVTNYRVSCPEIPMFVPRTRTHAPQIYSLPFSPWAVCSGRLAYWDFRLSSFPESGWLCLIRSIDGDQVRGGERGVDFLFLTLNVSLPLAPRWIFCHSLTYSNFYTAATCPGFHSHPSCTLVHLTSRC